MTILTDIPIPHGYFEMRFASTLVSSSQAVPEPSVSSHPAARVMNDPRSKFVACPILEPSPLPVVFPARMKCPCRARLSNLQIEAAEYLHFPLSGNEAFLTLSCDSAFPVELGNYYSVELKPFTLGVEKLSYEYMPGVAKVLHHVELFVSAAVLTRTGLRAKWIVFERTGLLPEMLTEIRYDVKMNEYSFKKILIHKKDGKLVLESVTEVNE